MARSLKQFAQIAQKNALVQMRMQFYVQYAERRAVPYAVVCAVPRAVVRAESCAYALAEHCAVIRADRFAERYAVMCADTICRNNCTDAETCAVLRAKTQTQMKAWIIFQNHLEFRYLYSTKKEKYSTEI